ncbi:MAG: MBL fold metallo-hydrolase [Mediterranea sp.]|jgi:glyoxylase-like metal-dependent hydrolase (beta-lactamase superfamily II)|nr:MBL fold metallo-hydrolase [Mediterranea sp.]
MKRHHLIAGILLAVCLVAVVLFVDSISEVDAQQQDKEQDSYTEREVFRNDDVVFRQIDDHTWEGNGHLVYNETLYIIEGNDRALLVDAGTRIADLDKIVAGITDKPVTFIATHVHGDHTGEAVKYFPVMYLNAADTVNIPRVMPDYKGELRYLTDGEVIDLGGRLITVLFTPGHTPGSITLMDPAAGYGFSGDAFGSSNLLLTMNFSTLLATCRKVDDYMTSHNIRLLYPGHYHGNNPETHQRVKDMATISREMLSGERKGEPNPGGSMGLNRIVTDYGVRINYNENAVE